MSDEPITHEELRRTLAKAMAAQAEAAAKAAQGGSVANAGPAKIYAEAAEKLANALAVIVSLDR